MSNQQDFLNSNEEDAILQEINAFLHRQQQYNQSTQVAMPHSFHQATTMENDGKQKTTPQPQNARPNKVLGVSAVIVTSSVPSKHIAAKVPVMRRMERSELEKGNKQRRPTPVHSKSSMPDLEVNRALTQILQSVVKNASPYRQIPFEKKTQDKNGDQSK